MFDLREKSYNFISNSLVRYVDIQKNKLYIKRYIKSSNLVFLKEINILELLFSQKFWKQKDGKRQD